MAKAQPKSPPAGPGSDTPTDPGKGNGGGGGGGGKGGGNGGGTGGLGGPGGDGHRYGSGKKAPEDDTVTVAGGPEPGRNGDGVEHGPPEPVPDLRDGSRALPPCVPVKPAPVPEAAGQTSPATSDASDDELQELTEEWADIASALQDNIEDKEFERNEQKDRVGLIPVPDFSGTLSDALRAIDEAIDSAIAEVSTFMLGAALDVAKELLPASAFEALAEFMADLEIVADSVDATQRFIAKWLDDLARDLCLPPEAVSALAAILAIVTALPGRKGVFRGAATAGKARSKGRRQGGVYTLRDGKGNVVRTGRTIDLEQRRKQHRRDEDLGKFEFFVEYETNDRRVRRGLEDIVHDSQPRPPKLDHIRPIALKNPRREEYRRAAERFLESKR